MTSQVIKNFGDCLLFMNDQDIEAPIGANIDVWNALIGKPHNIPYVRLGNA